MNKNIVIVVMRYLQVRWKHHEFVAMFGQPKADGLWNLYMNEYKGNPWKFFCDELTEAEQNAITIRAQKLSLSPEKRTDEEALYAMAQWPTYVLKKKLQALLTKYGPIIETPQDEDGVMFDFPCKNGMYTTEITGLGINDFGIYALGLYDGTEEIYGYIGDRNILQIKSLIDLAIEAIKKRRT